MKLTLISPRLALQKRDFLGSGVPYWPLELATFAAFVRNAGDSIELIDQFGLNPSRLSDEGDHYLQGEPIQNLIWRNYLDKSEAFVLFAISYMSHSELLTITQWLKKTYAKRPIAILENSQAVTAYSLQRMSNSFLQAGADMLICGEPYFNWDEIKKCLTHQECDPALISNIITKETSSTPIRLFGKTTTRYPIPAWDLINLQGYWRLPYSHGPKTRKFLPILTSRGCPYPCDFCVVPETNNRRWRGNEPEDVVEEIISLRDRFNVYDFQIEDLNPTVQHQRWERICDLLIERKANVRFYFVSGTKAETMHIDKIPLFAKAGCRYVSVSPESGSTHLMKIIGKKIRYQHVLNLIAACKKHGIRTQACLLVGHPEETKNDYDTTCNYLKQMIRAGLDEVAVFVVAPFAGSTLFLKDSMSIHNQSALPSFSPKGRSNYAMLNSRRQKLIRTFFITKLMQGMGLWKQGLRSLFGTPQTKMENLPRRVMFITWLVFKKNCRSWFQNENR